MTPGEEGLRFLALHGDVVRPPTSGEAEERRRDVDGVRPLAHPRAVERANSVPVRSVDAEVGIPERLGVYTAQPSDECPLIGAALPPDLVSLHRCRARPCEIHAGREE